ncbi:dynein regulatory complex protein 1 [Helicoverpa zea]|uniref:dynein regulatory complex protein 1 n=1 Tax=Helicoverpa zea TaxID=7113 RepID=UPI001F55F5C2|nr:dynein regulatory complex protein 1 [Helicoverpa zea]
MASRYADDEDDVLAPKEPQVTGLDPEERKAARSLRIKRRQDALKRADQPAEEAAAEEETSPIEQATATAAEELQRLALDGAAKVTNVKVTTDEREVVRRTQFFHKMNSSMQKIEAEANSAQIQYEAISGNWDNMLAIKDPLDIDAEMKEQKKKCDDLLAQKDALIAELKSDLKRMDEAYYADLEKQDNDIKELSDRIEKQVTIMQRAYAKQLGLIETAINIERVAMTEHNNKRWEALYKQCDKEEVAHLEYRFLQLDEHKREMETIMWDHHEKYREAKIELESLIQELQQELEKLKATCIINTEKIGYTYQVLKKREEENVFVRSQQKRKLNKMSDIANSLRSKIRKAADDGAIEEIKADAEIVKLMQTMDDLEKKSDHFSRVNHYKFTQVWRMSTARCTELSKQLRQGEIALHAHILAEPPPPPPLKPPKNPLSKNEHDSKRAAKDVVKKPTGTEVEEAKDKLVRHILQLVADNTGFLVEHRLLKLIEKYQLSSRNLCTLDAIFMALEIQAEEDVELLCSTFLNYAFCPICVGLEVATEPAPSASQDGISKADSSGAVNRPRGDRMSMVRGRASIAARSISASTSRSAHIGFKSHELSPLEQLMITEADEIMAKCGDLQANVMVTAGTLDTGSATGRRPGARGVTVAAQQKDDAGPPKDVNPFLCPLGHVLEIEPMQVLTALSEFIAAFVPPDKKRYNDILDSLKPPNFDTPSRKLTAEEISNYWTQWKNVFPPDKDKFWDGLLVGLNNYLSILQERERIHEEVVELRRRNVALRQLVRGALPELPTATPKYMRHSPRTFIAPVPDTAPLAYARLPPIKN